MGEHRLSLVQSKQDSSVPLDLLCTAYEMMNHDQRQAVFAGHIDAPHPRKQQ